MLWFSEEVKPKATELHGILWLAAYPKSGNTWTRNFLRTLLNLLEGIDEAEQDFKEKADKAEVFFRSGKSGGGISPCVRCNCQMVCSSHVCIDFEIALNSKAVEQIP